MPSELFDIPHLFLIIKKRRRQWKYKDCKSTAYDEVTSQQESDFELLIN